MVYQTRRGFLITLLALPILYYLPSFLSHDKKPEEETGFVRVNGWILKKEDLLLRKST